MAERSPDVTVIVLAGGEATRLPGKLLLDAGTMPLVVRCYRNVSPGRATVLSCKETLPYEVDALLEAPVVIDRWPARGPLSGLLSTMSEVRTPWVFAVAGDAPFVDTAFIDRLEAQIRPGDEAVVPRHAHAEPLAALYDRRAFLREGVPLLLAGEGALHAVIDRLRVRYVDVDDARIFTNVNTPADYDAVVHALT